MRVAGRGEFLALRQSFEVVSAREFLLLLGSLESVLLDGGVRAESDADVKNCWVKFCLPDRVASVTVASSVLPPARIWTVSNSVVVRLEGAAEEPSEENIVATWSNDDRWVITVVCHFSIHVWDSTTGKFR